MRTRNGALVLIAVLFFTIDADAATLSVSFGDKDCYGINGGVWPDCLVGFPSPWFGLVVNEPDDPFPTDLRMDVAPTVGCQPPPSTLCNTPVVALPVPLPAGEFIVDGRVLVGAAVVDGVNIWAWDHAVTTIGGTLRGGANYPPNLIDVPVPSAALDTIQSTGELVLAFRRPANAGADLLFLDFLELTLVTVPEPSSLLMALPGLALVIAWRRSRGPTGTVSRAK